MNKHNNLTSIFQDSKDRSGRLQSLEDTELYSVGAKESSKIKFHRNPLKTVSHAARTIRKSPKSQKKDSKLKGRVALMKVSIAENKDFFALLLFSGLMP